jgi:pyruvate kinase
LTAKDREDLQTGLALGVDYIALSFVRRHEDIEELKDLIARQGKPARVIAKLERPEALDDLDAILKAADAVMVARGDLGIELEPEKVPLVQKRIIREARRHNVCVITATQMLESMVNHPWPTRAETSDVANAVLDGTDAVMLSGETATGAYPVRAVQIMERIAREIETAAESGCNRRQEDSGGRESFAASIGWAAGSMASMTRARAICAFTYSGATARLIANTHPTMEIIGLTPNEIVQRQLNLAWGVEPVRVRPVPGVDEMIAEVERVVLQRGLAGEGDAIVIVAGYPLLQPGSTNLIKLHRVGGPDSGE